MLAHFSSVFRVLGASGASWVRSCVRWTIFSDVATISKGLGKVLERFLHHCLEDLRDGEITD